MNLDHAYVFAKKGGKLESNLPLSRKLKKKINQCMKSSMIKRNRAYIELFQDEGGPIRVSCSFSDVNPEMFHKAYVKLYRTWGNAALAENEKDEGK